MNGNRCNVPVCHEDQCGDGICIKPMMCKCPDGNVAKTCNDDTPIHEVSRCPEACLHGGRCINGECQCKEGWTGPHCGQPICGLRSDDMNGCRNGGRCIGPEKCACVYGFTGPNCEKDFRAGPCFTQMEDNHCFNQLEELYCTKALCCNTVGRAWGSPCEECPVKAAQCGRGFMPPSCSDINECDAISNVCKNCQCENTYGSYKCIAPEGFIYDSDRNECIDIDECDPRNNPCGDGQCINRNGGYECVCDEGYESITNPEGKQTCVYNGPGVCFEHVSNGACTDPLEQEISRSECCCIRGGNPTGQCFQTGDQSSPSVCPIPGTDAYTNLCEEIESKNEDNPDLICKLKGQCMNGKCVFDEDGQITCLCDDGYEADPIDLVCGNVNECDQGNMCPDGSCRDTDGSWYCDCNAGYEPSDDRQSCDQVNECLTDDKCDHGKCVDTNGSWRCECDDGFIADVRQKNQICIDVDECTLNGEKCPNGRCTNLIGSYQCVCNIGFEPSDDKKGCKDVNECEMENVCQNGECKNTPGSYKCICDQGFKYNRLTHQCDNVDECANNPCNGGTCIDTEGGFECECGKYRTIDASGRNCVDEQPGTCYRVQSRNKRKCRAEDALDTKMTRQSCCCHPTDKYPVSAFSLSHKNSCDLCPSPDSDDFAELCRGVKEPETSYCDLHLKPCINGECIDIEHGFECVCNEGFELSPDRTQCIDVNECDSKCLNGICTNLEGDFTCECPGGYHYNIAEGTCNDDDECLNQPCANGRCVNKNGGFECLCEDGLELDDTGLICRDVRMEPCWLGMNKDTCQDNMDGEYTAEVCCATEGTAWGDKCTDCSNIRLNCKKGFHYDIATEQCLDLNECQIFPNVCKSGAKCVNSIGSFACECPTGLTLDSSKRRCVDTREATCFQSYNGTHPYCHAPWSGQHTKKACCCSCAGGAWGSPCESCPQVGTTEFAELCPGGPETVNPDPDNPNVITPIDQCIEFPEICGPNGECKKGEGTDFECDCAPGFNVDGKGFPCIDVSECDVVDNLCGDGECVNTPGGYECNCKPGYTNAANNTCLNENECAKKPCLGGGQCVDTVGSFECVCPDGTHLADDQRHCVDDNECDLIENPCINGRCVNLIKDWQCQCDSGYELAPDKKGCHNKNECASGEDGCAHICHDTEGSYLCACNDGYILSPNGHDCIDIDECIEEPAICGGGRCINREGDFTCNCLPGYESAENGQLCINVDECAENPSICVHGNCIDTEGSFSCECFEGYCIALDTMLCHDEDECAIGAHICDANAECENKEGTYTCHCTNGFVGDGERCENINECDDDMHGCDYDADCLDTYGSYRCQCHPGYYGNGFNCSDILDCDNDENICGAHGTCINMPGDYACECEEGYTTTANQKDCMDIDECRGDRPVCENGNCVNMAGTFACECHPGYELSPDGQQCVDVDECMDDNDDMDEDDMSFDFMCLGGKCVNTPGSYVCECPQGFELAANGKGCVDNRVGDCYVSIEEDAYGNNVCSNMIGASVHRAACCCSAVGYSWGNPCERCPADGTDELASLCPSGVGFVPDSLTVLMEDIDECTELPGACQGGNCINEFGSYQCLCPEGYELDDQGLVCHDINECADDENPCGEVGKCKNKVGTYTCDCPVGYITKNQGRECRDNRLGACFREYSLNSLTGKPQCSGELLFQATRKSCCCNGNIGAAWEGCEKCPTGADKVDYCQDSDDPCATTGLCEGGVCISQPGHNFQCECPFGLEYDAEHFMCVDVDECVNPSLRSDCPANSKCENTYGSYDCVCVDGFADDGNGECDNINECRDVIGTCRNGECRDTMGGFVCDCNEGYELSDDSKSCNDLNECSYHFQCGQPDAVSRCVNIEGSYRCICNAGFKLNADMQCENINECDVSGNYVCRNGDCEDTRGSFQCHCHPGFQLSGDNRNCVDINECENNPCGYGECVNTNGGYSCECAPGYEEQDGTCVDHDECNDADGKDAVCKNGYCHNTPEGSFTCTCPYGYEKTYDGSDCVDTREGTCDIGSNDCSQTNPLKQSIPKSSCCCQCHDEASWLYQGVCTSCPKQGSEEFEKLCPRGCGHFTTPDGHDRDINECSLMDDCCTNGKCINTDGSYFCECPDGFHLDSDGHTCIDKDECSSLVNPCGKGSCSNTEGSYSCLCDDGLVQSSDGKCVGMFSIS